MERFGISYDKSYRSIFLHLGKRGYKIYGAGRWCLYFQNYNENEYAAETQYGLIGIDFFIGVHF